MVPGTFCNGRLVEDADRHHARAADLADAPLDVAGQLEVREAGDELLDRDLELEPGEVRAEAAVDAETERGVRFSSRSMTNDSASSNCFGSRLAAGNGSSTQSSFFIGQPWKSLSLATSAPS